MLVLGLASAVFAKRAVVDGYHDGLDFILVYSDARAWLQGRNPYDMTEVDAAWENAGGPVERRPSSRAVGDIIYPPSTLVLLSPWAALPWWAARPAWIAGNIVFLGLSVWALARMVQLRWNTPWPWLLLGAAMLFMPVHTTFRHGQTPLYVLAMLCVAGAWPGRWFAGVLLGIASVTKPQMGLPFVALDVVRRRWASVMAAVVAAVAVGAIAIAPMMLRGIPWWSHWQANLRNFQHAGQGDPTAANPMRHQLVNLHYPLHTIIENRAAVSVLVLAICAALAAVFFLWPRKRDDGHVLSLSMVAVLSLMVVYHRFYDAVLLLMPMAWAYGSVLREPRRLSGWAVLALSLPFFLNASSALYWFEYWERVPDWLTSRWIWNGVLKPCQAWALLAMACVLTWVQLHPREDATVG